MEQLHPDTVAVISGRPERVPGGPLNTPIVPASTYHAGADPVYGRDGNPGWEALETAFGALEGGTAVSFASGMAGCAAVLDELPAGAVVVAQTAPYWGVVEQLRERQSRGLIELRTLESMTEATLREVVPGAALVWIESPTNPMLDVVDIAGAASLAHAHGALVLVDNTFATPLLQNPIQLGADLVVHSATKLIGGHSDLLLGVVVCREDEWAERLTSRRYATGGVPGALEAFLALRGLRSLPARLARAQATAAELAERLQGHAAVARVRYPRSDRDQVGVPGQMRGGGAMVSFETHGAAADAEAVCTACRLIVSATSLGGVESSMERRAKYSADRAAGVPDTLIRLSVGLEHVDDLWRDLDRALGTIET